MVPKKPTILLVEDDEAIREMYCIKFAQQNIEIEIASDGIEALKKARRLKPDVLLLDIKIPTIGGEEVLEKLQRETWAVAMKVIILTNINRREAPQKLHQLHYDRYIVKAHSTPAKVVRVVQSVLTAK